MHQIVLSDEPRRWVLVFETGDELLDGLTGFARHQRLLGAGFTAIGAFASVRLGWFDWETKAYRVAVNLDEQVELVSMVGDIAEYDGGPQVHAHVVVGRSSGAALGGHLQRATVRPTCEVILEETEERLRKRVDPESGLPLIRRT